MADLLTKILPLVLIGIFSGCSQVLETIDLRLDNEDSLAQEDFKVIEKTLTLVEAKKQNEGHYLRHIIQNGRGDEAKIISENEASTSSFPAKSERSSYRLGIGDTVTFSRLIDNRTIDTEIETTWPPSLGNSDYQLGIGDELTILQMVDSKVVQGSIAPQSNENETSQTIMPTETEQKVIEAKGRIGSDGSILLLEVGRLDALNKTLNELRSEVRNILIRNGSSPRFQLEISQFRSQRAYLTMNENSTIIELNDQRTDLRDVLSEAGKGITPGIVTIRSSSF